MLVIECLTFSSNSLSPPTLSRCNLLLQLPPEPVLSPIRRLLFFIIQVSLSLSYSSPPVIFSFLPLVMDPFGSPTEPDLYNTVRYSLRLSTYIHGPHTPVSPSTASGATPLRCIPGNTNTASRSSEWIRTVPYVMLPPPSPAIARPRVSRLPSGKPRHR